MQQRVYCLYRVSTAKQVDHTDTNQADIPMQRKACREFAKKMGWTIIREEQEAGVSGYKISADHRDKLQLIRDHAKQGKFDILLVFMFDRLGRKSDETPFVVEWFVKNGIRVWSVNEGEQRFDCHTDRLMNYIRFWQADGESQKTSYRTKVALGQMVQEGRFRGGFVPFGYKLVPSGVLNKRKHEVNKLEIEEAEARVVRMIYDMNVCCGYGRWKIATMLNEQGIFNRGGKRWHEATIGHILRNITYAGVLRSGETYSEIFPELQIISMEKFEQAQQLMKQRTNEHNDQRTMPRQTTGQALLSGNIFCGHCGGRLILTTSNTARKTASGERVVRKRFRYICYNKTRHRSTCKGQTGYTSHILDDLIESIVKDYLGQLGPIDKDRILEQMHLCSESTIEVQIRHESKKLKLAEQEYETLKSEVGKALLNQSQFSAEVLAQALKETQERIRIRTEHMATLRAELMVSKERMSAIGERLNKLTWADLFDLSSKDVKKMVICHLIHRAFVFRGYALCLEVKTPLIPTL